MSIAYTAERFVSLAKTRKSLLWGLAVRSLLVRYQGSVFGFLWTLLSPVLQIAVYSLVFGVVMRVGMKDYWLYLFNGIVFWGIISSTLLEAPASILGSSRLVSRAGLPSEIIPCRIVLTLLLNYLIVLPVYLACFFMFRGPLTIHFAQILFILPLTLMFCLASALILAYLGAIFRDIQHFIQVIVQLLFFTTPITYVAERITGKLEMVLQYSPFTAVVSMNADALFLGRMVDPTHLYVFSLWTLALWGVAFLVHTRFSSTAIEVV
ncbi:MAG: ABC transporter permease [Zetaproteobacteria bacterium]|nr:ABC transporter permease [Zetaproteobacteria bacterium]